MQTVIDVDLTRFYDSIDHRLLLEVGEEKVADRRFMRYVARLLKAGVLADGELSVTEGGTPHRQQLCAYGD